MVAVWPQEKVVIVDISFFGGFFWGGGGGTGDGCGFGGWFWVFGVAAWGGVVCDWFVGFGVRS